MQRERKKEAMVLKCLKCAIVATQATPSSPHSPVVSLIPKLGLPLFMLMLQPERDHTVCPLGFAVDLICWNNSRFPPCAQPSCFIAWVYNTRFQPRWVGEFLCLKLGQDHSGFWMNYSLVLTPGVIIFRWTCFSLIQVNTASPSWHLNIQNNLSFLKLCS